MQQSGIRIGLAGTETWCNSTTSRGRQCDRTPSLPANSRKREYQNCRPETFGNLAAPGVDFATQRLSQMDESPPNAGLSRLIGRCRRMSGLVGWSERIRTHAFPIEPGLYLPLLLIWEYGPAGPRGRSPSRILHCTVCQKARVPAEFALYLGGSGAWPLSRRVSLHTGEKCCLKGTPFQPKCSR